jgi:hypothetical protein
MWVKEFEGMSTVIDKNLRNGVQTTMNLLVSGAAANEDHLPGRRAGFVRGADTGEQASGWNAYDVWRRLIKDARDRREATGKLQR